MLSLKELEDSARLKRLSLINAEKDYLQEVILSSIYSFVGRELVFKGGTCLYKLYKLNRFSEDLDFTLMGKLDIEKLGKRIVYDLGLLNVRGIMKDFKEYKNEINVKLLLNGPLFRGRKETQCFIPLNISTRERLGLESRKKTLISVYNEIPSFEVFAMSEEEMLSEKTRAILTRQKPRDVYDLWFLVKKKDVSVNLELINKKLSMYGMNFDYKIFSERIEDMRGLWDRDLSNLIFGELESFELVRKELIEVFGRCLEKTL